jgi:hypothetical protein
VRGVSTADVRISIEYIYTHCNHQRCQCGECAVCSVPCNVVVPPDIVGWCAIPFGQSYIYRNNDGTSMCRSNNNNSNIHLGRCVYVCVWTYTHTHCSDRSMDRWIAHGRVQRVQRVCVGRTVTTVQPPPFGWPAERDAARVFTHTHTVMPHTHPPQSRYRYRSNNNNERPSVCVVPKRGENQPNGGGRTIPTTTRWYSPFCFWLCCWSFLWDMRLVVVVVLFFSREER